MSNLTIWEPMRDLMSMREWMDRAMGDFWGRNRELFEGFSAPAIDLYQTEDEVVVKATLPGVNPDDMQVSVTGDVLTIRGEVKKDEETKDATYQVRERRYGSFERAISLPISVVADRARAEFENGVLTLTLPKAEEVRSKTIRVKVKGS